MNAYKPLILLLLVIVLIGVLGRANAAEVRITCTPPTQNTDGTPITASLSYRAYWGTSATSLTTGMPLAGPGCSGPVVVPDPAAGTSVTYHFAVTATANGMESAKSNIATKVVSTPLPTPKPPILVTVGGLVYQASPDWTRFAWKLGAQVGTIGAGIQCDASRRIGEDHYRVTGPIVWTGGKKSYVVAQCGAAGATFL